MFTSPFAHAFVVLSKNMIQKDPGIIVGPITQVLGAILNAIFNFVYQFTASNSLGFSIILLTIITRFLMLPLAVQQQKSMISIQKLQPEMDKIKKKYGNTKDPEITQKMNAEVQKLYSENKINPLMGCLPLVIQMPIFVALSYIMQQSYRFIGVLGDLYYKIPNSLAQTILSTEGWSKIITLLGNPKIPKGMDLTISTETAELLAKAPENLAKVINRFSPSDWTQLLASMPEGTQAVMRDLMAHKAQIEYFFGIDLIDNAMTFSGGFANVIAHMWPGVLIPLLATVTTFLSSYIMNKQSTATDDNAKMQQKMMLIFMPIMMGFMTAGFPAGVGLYWITSTVFQIVQQVLLHKYYFKVKKVEAVQITSTQSIKKPADKGKKR